MKKWGDYWKILSPIKEGGDQGDCYIVCRFEDSEEKQYFLKVIKKNANTNTRKRFCREIQIYNTTTIERIPRIIDFNAELESIEDLYCVAEYINGDRLDKYDENEC